MGENSNYWNYFGLFAHYDYCFDVRNSRETRRDSEKLLGATIVSLAYFWDTVCSYNFVNDHL